MRKIIGEVVQYSQEPTTGVWTIVVEDGTGERVSFGPDVNEAHALIFGNAYASGNDVDCDYNPAIPPEGNSVVNVQVVPA